MAFSDLTDPVFEAIRTHLTSAWTETPIGWPNEAHSFEKASDPWVLVEYAGTVYGQQSLGAGEQQEENRWDADGILWMHLFVPVGSGSRNAQGGAKRLAELFRGALLLDDALEFLDAEIGLGEPGADDGKWWRVSVAIGWRHTNA
ncbi:MAG: phage tail terminator-like protein [Bradyrhizobium sp.]|uniref:phage tail terminator-like protein n=1 Tax=Bradyrhizobium sp. TaxID=376 RepID=UPI003D10FC4B